MLFTPADTPSPSPATFRRMKPGRLSLQPLVELTLTFTPLPARAQTG